MAKVLLPTIEPPGAKGGIARYLQAIVDTFPHEVELINVAPTYLAIFRNVFWQPRKNVTMTWVNHALPVGTVAWLWQYVSKKPYTIFLHGLDFDLARRNVWKRWLTRRILSHAKHVVTNSQALKKEVQHFAPTAPTPLVVYPVTSDELITAARELPHINFEQPVPLTLLSVSRLVARKGQIKVLKALKEFPEIQYVIVGDGPEKKLLQQTIKDLHLETRVFLVPQVEDQGLITLYRTADIFVLPTSKTAIDREGFGIVYLEAQLFGLPVVATNHPGVNEAIKNEETGLLIEDTPQALSAALRRLIDNPQLRQRLGSNGPAWVQKNFTRQQQMSKLTACL